MTQKQIDAINEIATQLAKAKAEILGKIKTLEDAIAAGDDEAAIDAALAALKGQVQGFDDIVPDATLPSDSDQT